MMGQMAGGRRLTAAVFLVATAAPSVGVANVTVDNTEDEQGTGFPDQRKVARDSLGNLFVAYRKKDANQVYRIYVAKSDDDGSSWTVSGAPIDTVGPYTQRVPAIAVDGSDRVHVVWYGNDAANNGNEREIMYTRSLDHGATWQQTIKIVDYSGYAGESLWQEHPTIHARAENVYVVWQSQVNNVPQTRFVASTNGGQTWGSPTIVRPSSNNRSRPSIITTSDGILHVFAYGYMGSAQQILWSYYKPFGGWTAWTQIAASTSDQRHFSVAADPTIARIYAVWRENTANGPRIHAAVMTSNQWALDAAPIASGTLDQCYPSVTATSQRVLVVWTNSTNCAAPNDRPQNGEIVMSTRSFSSSRWSSPVSIAASPGEDVYPILRWQPVDYGGNADMVWIQGTKVTNTPCPDCTVRHTSIEAW
ncbi:MAG: sialidase family protein [Myxococcota bacterium]